MKLTRMALDTQKRRTMFALSSPSIFHGTVESAFPGERRRNLWRVDQLKGMTYLMILSDEEPDLTQAAEELGYPAEGWESKDYDPLLDRIADGTTWRFRLCANPTYSESRPEGRGKIHAHRTPEHQSQWLVQQGQRHGFSVTPDSFVITQSRWYHFRKGNGTGKAVKLLAVTYEGMLTVTDAEAFREILQTGLGREKAYGMGLMTLVKGTV